jgi:hypothetical protein
LMNCQASIEPLWILQAPHALGLRLAECSIAHDG